ncbi:MAG TPA: Ig-like domain-containing protein [Kofleriaceae bacterium]|nr:Ig-like domain-containing protein [Kofleriaceae bacterium]
MRIATIIAGAVTASLVPSLAAAEAVRDLPDPSAITFVRKEIPPSGVYALAQSKIIYLNHTGVTLRPGNDDARTNRSSIVSQQVSVPAWNTSAAHWQQTVTCMKDMFKRWDVVVTDVDPGNVPHMEAVFGGSPQNVGMGQGVGGVSPFTQDCGVIENSIVFTFTSVFPDDPQTVCEVMAQEVAHSYGLDHEMLASDPMTYLNYNGNRTFKDQTVACGEYSNRPCGIGGSTCRPNQNSVQLLNQRLGQADLVAPTLGITSPADGATVEPGFAVDATASDNIAVTAAQLFIDDQPVTTAAGAGPYTFATDAALAEGVHTISVEATDGKNPTRKSITVTVAKAGSGDGSGSGSGSDEDGDGVPDGAGGDGDDDGDLIGGCNSGHDVGFAVGLFVLAQIVLRRRRYD